MTRVNQDCSRRSSNAPKCYACVIKLSSVMIVKVKCVSKGLNQRALEDSEDGLMAKYRQKLDKPVNLKSTNRGFKTINQGFATCEQTKKN